MCNRKRAKIIKIVGRANAFSYSRPEWRLPILILSLLNLKFGTKVTLTVHFPIPVWNDITHIDFVTFLLEIWNKAHIHYAFIFRTLKNNCMQVIK